MKNGQIQEEKRIVFNEFYQSKFGDMGFVFSIYLNNKEEEKLVGRVYFGGDSLYTWYYPFDQEDDHCETSKNIFYKK